MRTYTNKSWKDLPKNLRFSSSMLNKIGHNWVIEVWSDGKCIRYVLPGFIDTAFEHMIDVGRAQARREIKQALGLD